MCVRPVKATTIWSLKAFVGYREIYFRGFFLEVLLKFLGARTSKDTLVILVISLKLLDIVWGTWEEQQTYVL